MQMPPSDEIVMVSGCLPFLAKKLRYFEDRNFAERILSPPEDPLRLQSARANWPERVDSVPSVKEFLGPISADGGWEISPTFGSPEQTRPIERDTDAPPEFEDSEDVDAAQTLETLRQAATLDLADDNTLPEF